MTGPTKFPRSAMTKLLLICVLILAAALPGCGWTKRQFTGSTSPAPIAKSVEPSAKVIVTPDVSLAAKVILVNLEGRYVILNFPSGELPRLQQTLFLYRDGLKMASWLTLLRATPRWGTSCAMSNRQPYSGFLGDFSANACTVLGRQSRL